MNDETEQFEQRLKRRPLRPVPGEWRNEILSTAMEARPLQNSSPAQGESLLTKHRGSFFALTPALSPRRGRSYRLISAIGRLVRWRQAIRHSTKSGVPALLNNIRIGTRPGEVRTALHDASDAGKLTFLPRLSSWLWPHPVAWGGLGAVWILIFAVHFSIRDDDPALAKKVVPQSQEVVAQLKQQQRLLAELLGPSDLPDADRPKIFVPKPRSESTEILSA